MNDIDATECPCSTPCTSCGCSECGALVDRDTLRPLTLPAGRVVQACRECMAEGEPVAPAPRSFKVVDMKGKRIAGPFATFAEAIEWSRQIRDVGVTCTVKEVR